jgi:hypothetical protein
VIAKLRQELDELRSSSILSQQSAQKSFDSESLTKSEVEAALQDVRRDNQHLEDYLATRRRLEELLAVLNDSVSSFSGIRDDSPQKRAALDEDECHVDIDDVDQIARPEANVVVSGDEEPEHKQQPAVIAKPPAVGDAQSDVEERAIAATPSEEVGDAKADRILGPQSPPRTPKRRADSGKKPDSAPSGSGPSGAARPDDSPGSTEELGDDFGDDDEWTELVFKPREGRSSGLGDGRGLSAGGKRLAEQTKGQKDVSGEEDGEEDFKFIDEEEDLLNSPALRARPAESAIRPARPPAGPTESPARSTESPARPPVPDKGKSVDDAKGSGGEEKEEEEEDTRPVLSNLDCFLRAGDGSGGHSKADDDEEEEESTFVVKGRSASLAERNAQVGEGNDASDDSGQPVLPIRRPQQASPKASVSAEDDDLDGFDSDSGRPQSDPVSAPLESDEDFDDLAEAPADARHPERVPGKARPFDDVIGTESEDDDGDLLVPPPRPQQAAAFPNNGAGRPATGRPARPAAQANDEADNDYGSDDELIGPVAGGRFSRVADQGGADGEDEEDNIDIFLGEDDANDRATEARVSPHVEIEDYDSDFS